MEIYKFSNEARQKALGKIIEIINISKAELKRLIDEKDSLNVITTHSHILICRNICSDEYVEEYHNWAQRTSCEILIMERDGDSDFTKDSEIIKIILIDFEISDMFNEPSKGL